MLHKLQRHQNPDSEPWQVHTWRDGIAEYTRFVEANNISWGQRDINLVEPFTGGKIFNQWVPMRLKQFNYIKVFLIWYLYVETIRLYNSSAVMNCILLCCMKPWFTQISSSKKFRSKTSKFYVGFYFFGMNDLDFSGKSTIHIHNLFCSPSLSLCVCMMKICFAKVATKMMWVHNEQQQCLKVYWFLCSKTFL